jgi:hypothetical protein
MKENKHRKNRHKTTKIDKKTKRKLKGLSNIKGKIITEI